MTIVNLSENETSFSDLIDILESGTENAIYFCRGDRTIAKLSLLDSSDVDRRIGIAEGLLVVPDDLDKWDADILEIFEDYI